MGRTRNVNDNERSRKTSVDPPIQLMRPDGAKGGSRNAVAKHLRGGSMDSTIGLDQRAREQKNPVVFLKQQMDGLLHEIEE